MVFMAFITSAPLALGSSFRPAHFPTRRCKTAAHRHCHARCHGQYRMQADDMDNSPRLDDPTHMPNGNVNEEQAEEATDVTMDVQVREPSLAELKCELYAVASTTNRGLLQTAQATSEISSLLHQLERQNPTPSPMTSPSFAGVWRLLYTNALDILSLGLLAPLALVNQVYQNISFDPQSDGYIVENVIDLEPTTATITNKFLGRTMAKVVVEARASVQSPSIASLTFDNVSFRPQSLVGLRVSDIFRSPKVPLGRPVGAIDTTFLDDDLRISRVTAGNGKNVFVLVREQGEP